MQKKCTANQKSTICKKDRSSTKSSQRRSCSSESPSNFCSSLEKRSECRKKSSPTKRRECCCGVPKKKCEKRSEKPVKGSQTHRSVAEERIITFEDLRPCYCREAGPEPVRKKAQNSGSSLLCCSCFTNFWKKRSDKKKASRTAPCKRYLCLHNPGRSELDEPVPCVKCTHNCKARSPASVGKGSRKKSLSAKTAVGACSDRSTKTNVQKLESEENFRKDIDTGEPEIELGKRGVKENRNDGETSSLEDIPDERPNCAREKSRRKEKKVCKRVKRRKKSKKRDRCLRNTATILPPEDTCCPCETPEEVVQLKAKPCMKCPKKMTRENNCKKLTFASCAELRDYQIRNQCPAPRIKKKKRTLMGVLFDVIFWPYVFWPR